jgi:hypothetical protein
MQRRELLLSGTMGDPSITSRATDTAGTIQPAMDDPTRRITGEQWPDQPSRKDRLGASAAIAKRPAQGRP